MNPSEFIASQDLQLYHLNEKPCPSTKEGAIYIGVKKGEPIPELFIPLILKKNLNFVENVVYKNSEPVFTEEQKVKYGLVDVVSNKDMKVKRSKYSYEALIIKLNELDEKEFKKWLEKETGYDLDRRKSARELIVEVLRIQAEELL
uniref:Uncharacterized protein n=1 Tax=viral metagenome TaxID=1070528 RepID=A0A6M3LMP2_9ZZZZ